MVSIEAYSKIHKSRWDDFINLSKNSTFLFRRDFMDYHSDKFDDHSLLVFKDSELIALFPSNTIGKSVYSHQGLTYGGILVKSDMKFTQYLELFENILNYYFDKSFEKLFIKQIPSIYNSDFNGELDYLAFITEANIYRRDIISVIDMQNDFNFSKDRIQGYKRGVKNNLEIKETDDLDEFWNIILIPRLSDKHSVKPVHNLGEIQKLKNNFKQNIRQFNVYHDGEIVAGTTIFQTKNVIHVQYIGSNMEKNLLGSLDFLFYNLITKIFPKHKYFDFGTSNEQQGKKINKGLIYWKEGYGAKSLIQDFYEIEISKFDKLRNLIV